MIHIPRRLLLYRFILTGIMCFGSYDSILVRVTYSQPNDQSPVSIATETVEFDSIPPDSTHFDTAIDDSLTSQQDEGVDTTVSYWADDIDFDVKARITYLTGHAKIQYKGMTLSAAWISVDWNKNLMTAGGTLDTLYTDSTETEIDTTFWVGQPIFTNQTLTGTETMYGDNILYNFKTRKGRVLKGRTQYLDGFYWGDRVKRIEEDTYFIERGIYTTCDQEDDPHYHFRTREMKMIYNDKVIAKPIVLYFSTVPVAIVPYGIFPNKRGRHSGILMPTYGETADEGRFLEGIGYYFALSDYCDLETSVDYFERFGFKGRGRFRYNVRYLLNGSVNGSFVRKNLENGKERQWDVRAHHDQTIDPWTHLLVDLHLLSNDSYYIETSNNVYDRLDKTISSDATLNHSWPGTKSSMSLNLHHEQNLEDNTFTQIMPRISYRYGRSQIITPPEESEEDPKWFHKLYWSYSGEGLNRRTSTAATPDRWRGGVRHSLNFDTPQNAVKYLTISPFVRVTEDWFAEYKEYHWQDNTTRPETVDKFRHRTTFSLGANFNTTLYGTFLNPFNVGADFRHKMTPTITATYQPDFSKPKWGYYGTLQIPDSTEYTWDRFAGSVYGNTPSTELRRLGLSLNNLFQLKRTTEEEVIRRDLFNLNFSISHNFAADAFPWSNLSTSFRSTPISGAGVGPLKSLSTSLSLSHSLYQDQGGQRIERFVWEDFTWSNPEILRLLTSNLSVTMRLSGGGQQHTSSFANLGGFNWQEPEQQIPQDTTQLAPTTTGEEPAIWNMLQAPWSITLTSYYNINHTTDTKTARISGSAELELTPKWRIGYSTYIDPIDGSVVSGGLTVYRDLHCWEGRFEWNPSGLGAGYYLIINVKSLQLSQDIKFERQRGNR